MSDDWEAFSKRIIWRNALGENPVAVLLYNSVEDLVAKKDPLTFDTAHSGGAAGPGGLVQLYH